MFKSKQKLIEYIKTAFIGILVIFIYFFISYFQTLFLDIVGIDYNNLSTTIKIIYILIWEFLELSLIMLLLNKKISKDIKDMKKNHRNYFNKYFKFWLLAIAIMMMSNLLINIFINNGLPSNEETIRELFKISPIYIFISSVIVAPIVEELVFRQAFRNIITNKYLFIIVSGLIFGGLHVVGSMTNLTDLFYLIPYCTPGFIFAYILADSDNILISSGLHFMHNGILLSLQFIILFFG